jgi:Holliday junction DNA helicase RuvA
MISKLKGKIEQILEYSLILKANHIWYEIFIPISILNTFKQGDEVELYTIHYYHQDGNKLTPYLIGFRNEIEREFFEHLIGVSGIGPKMAVKALKYPVAQIAIAIDRGDERFLSTLPGIGRQRARQIIAKLQGRVGKYALVKEGEKKPPAIPSDIREEALEILLKLEYKKKEAEEMIEQALIRNPGISSSEELLNEIYKSRIAGK